MRAAARSPSRERRSLFANRAGPIIAGAERLVEMRQIMKPQRQANAKAWEAFSKAG
jgi:hypothetical protein